MIYPLSMFFRNITNDWYFVNIYRATKYWITLQNRNQSAKNIPNKCVKQNATHCNKLCPHDLIQLKLIKNLQPKILTEFIFK